MRRTTVLAAGLAAMVAACSGRSGGGSASPPATATPADAGGAIGHDSGSSTTALRVPELGPIPPLPDFPGDPVTPEKLALGTELFFDIRLSGSGQTNCAACHLTGTAFQDNLNLATPDRSYPHDSPTVSRNTLSFFNIVYAPIYRWEGSHTDLVDVMAFPLAEPNMNVAKLPAGNEVNDVPAAKKALYAKLTTELTGYAAAYQRAFGVDIAAVDAEATWKLTGRALRAFVTQAVSRDSAFDRWNAGDDGAMDASAVRGLDVFRGKGRCVNCHGGPFFTDFSFHNISTSPPRADGTRADEGHFEVTGRDQDHGAFLTPTLRSAYDTSPYLHDGSQGGLRDVLGFLASADVTKDPNRDVSFRTPLPLDEGDVADLVAFLKALRGAPIAPITAPTSFP